MASQRKRVPWSHWDRLLMIVLSVVLVLVVSLGLWLHGLEADPVVSVPTPPMPNPNAHDLLTSADSEVVDARKLRWALEEDLPTFDHPRNARKLTTAQKDALLRENADVLLSVRRSLRHSYRKPPIRSLSKRASEGASFGEIADLLELDAQVNNGRKNWGAAFEAEMDLVQLGETVRHGGATEDMRAGIEWQKLARLQAWRTGPHLTAFQAKAAGQRLETLRAADVPFAETIQEEKWVGQSCLLEIMRHRNWRGTLIANFGDGEESSASWLQRAGMTRLRFTSKQTMMANYTRYMGEAIANASLPYAPKALVSETGDGLFPDNLFPDYTEAYFDKTNNDTQNSLLLTTVALRAYKLDHGAYPAALSALVPGYLKSVPADPFARSGPLRYKIIGGKYVLYSVGPDGIDDGGKAIDEYRPPCDHPSDTDGRPRIYDSDKGDILSTGFLKSYQPCSSRPFGG